MFVLINVLYFANIIPPIPLVLKEAGVYHLVGRTAEGTYVARTEPRKWNDFLAWYRPTVHHVPGEPVYFYSAVFAPTRLEVAILHEWQYFDSKKDEWVTTDLLRFRVIGGRDGGYRGYSVKENLFAGRWRVNVITKRGQPLGRTSFMVIDTPVAPMLETKMFGS
ncbi:MAG: DUF2914 domain-containing protein [Minisyncoccota bacterium]